MNKKTPEIIKKYKTTYAHGKQLFSKEYRVNKIVHRLDGPAHIEYYPSGKINYETYYINGKVHRLDGPAVIRYYEHGGIMWSHYCVNGIYLTNISSYSKKEIFEYAQRYPILIKEIELLARYNNWLNEKELELLVCMDMFNE